MPSPREDETSGEQGRPVRKACGGAHGLHIERVTSAVTQAIENGRVDYALDPLKQLTPNNKCSASIPCLLYRGHSCKSDSVMKMLGELCAQSPQLVLCFERLVKGFATAKTDFSESDVRSAIHVHVSRTQGRGVTGIVCALPLLEVTRVSDWGAEGAFLGLQAIANSATQDYEELLGLVGEPDQVPRFRQHYETIRAALTVPPSTSPATSPVCSGLQDTMLAGVLKDLLLAVECLFEEERANDIVNMLCVVVLVVSFEEDSGQDCKWREDRIKALLGAESGFSLQFGAETSSMERSVRRASFAQTLYASVVNLMLGSLNKAFEDGLAHLTLSSVRQPDPVSQCVLALPAFGSWELSGLEEACANFANEAIVRTLESHSSMELGRTSSASTLASCSSFVSRGAPYLGSRGGSFIGTSSYPRRGPLQSINSRNPRSQLSDGSRGTRRGSIESLAETVVAEVASPEKGASAPYYEVFPQCPAETIPESECGQTTRTSDWEEIINTLNTLCKSGSVTEESLTFEGLRHQTGITVTESGTAFTASHLLLGSASVQYGPAEEFCFKNCRKLCTSYFNHSPVLQKLGIRIKESSKEKTVLSMYQQQLGQLLDCVKNSDGKPMQFGTISLECAPSHVQNQVLATGLHVRMPVEFPLQLTPQAVKKLVSEDDDLRQVYEEKCLEEGENEDYSGLKEFLALSCGEGEYLSRGEKFAFTHETEAELKDCMKTRLRAAQTNGTPVDAFEVEDQKVLRAILDSFHNPRQAEAEGHQILTQAAHFHAWKTGQAENPFNGPDPSGIYREVMDVTQCTALMHQLTTLVNKLLFGPCYQKRVADELLAVLTPVREQAAVLSWVSLHDLQGPIPTDLTWCKESNDWVHSGATKLPAIEIWQGWWTNFLKALSVICRDDVDSTLRMFEMKIFHMVMLLAFLIFQWDTTKALLVDVSLFFLHATHPLPDPWDLPSLLFHENEHEPGSARCSIPLNELIPWFCLSTLREASGLTRSFTAANLSSQDTSTLLQDEEAFLYCILRSTEQTYTSGLLPTFLYYTRNETTLKHLENLPRLLAYILSSGRHNCDVRLRWHTRNRQLSLIFLEYLIRDYGLATPQDQRLIAGVCVCEIGKMHPSIVEQAVSVMVACLEHEECFTSYLTPLMSALIYGVVGLYDIYQDDGSLEKRRNWDAWDCQVTCLHQLMKLCSSNTLCRQILQPLVGPTNDEQDWLLDDAMVSHFSCSPYDPDFDRCIRIIKIWVKSSEPSYGVIRSRMKTVLDSFSIWNWEPCECFDDIPAPPNDSLTPSFPLCLQGKKLAMSGTESMDGTPSQAMAIKPNSSYGGSSIVLYSGSGKGGSGKGGSGSGSSRSGGSGGSGGSGLVREKDDSIREKDVSIREKDAAKVTLAAVDPGPKSLDTIPTTGTIATVDTMGKSATIGTVATMDTMDKSLTMDTMEKAATIGTIDPIGTMDRSAAMGTVATMDSMVKGATEGSPMDAIKFVSDEAGPLKGGMGMDGARPDAKEINGAPEDKTTTSSEAAKIVKLQAATMRAESKLGTIASISDKS